MNSTRPDRSTNTKSDELPFVSVIMPIRNEADFIERSLGAVLNQDYPHENTEVLVVDGMSTDSTRELVQRVAAKHPSVSVRLLDNPGKIVPKGLNIALSHVKGDIVIRVDGHCEIASDYITRCVAHLQSSDAAGVGGPIETVSDTPIGRIISIAMSSKFGVGGSAFRTIKDRSLFVDTVAFPAYRREVIEKAGPFDESLMRNQDDEYNYRLRALGYKILLTPDIRSTYYSRGSIQKLWRQYYQYGFYKVRVMKKHPRQMSLRQFAPPLLVTLVGLGAVAAPFNKVVRWLWFTLVATYILANLIASLFTARKHTSSSNWILPLVFATLHFSYGLGFIVGLLKSGIINNKTQF